MTQIRSETLENIEAIEQITIAAFLDHPYSHQSEQRFVRALREGSALVGDSAYRPFS